ncbi:LAME_0H13146g1_1 [Lachancea meyersii CBS 8951]|uniref:LAME_0H13146g1_1 n=1 Tax=Lachancea meyersii CBS 8951 TaxID=1266667 RepID=A0A1G4KH48_9SACH|nr:LAME_0H13146g1_1 [Lachancea meyersii CBS 8951]
MDSSLYSGFYTSQKLVDEFNMLQDNLPITLKEKDSTEYDDNYNNDEINESTASQTSLINGKVVPPPQPAVIANAVVRKIDILQAVFNTLGGKDKLAKILKYVLDLLKLFVGRSRASITTWDPQVLQHYSKVLSQLNMRLMLKHPVTIFKIVTVACLRNFESRASIISTSLSLFRQILRFGGTPFRVVAMCQKISSTLHQISASKQSNLLQKSAPTSSHALAVVNKVWLNESSLADFIDLYYGIMDELALLHKFKLWNHATLFQWVSKHEALSWYYDIMLGLKNNWVALQDLNRAQLELEIQIQVKKRALELSSRLQDRAASPIKQQLLQDLQASNNGNTIVLERIHELERERKTVMLDLVRLSFDFLADSTDVFNLKTPPGTYALLSLASGLTGFVKLWGNAKRELSNNVPST